jgi:DNA modification methylase
VSENKHPTVKSTKLMAYLVRLITPPGGTVLDPFAGSGSTGVAALEEGFQFLGIEKEPEYYEIAKESLGA